MPSIACKCPQCHSELRFNVEASLDIIRVNCPRCKKPFDLRLAPHPTHSPRQQQTSGSPLSQLDARELGPQPVASYMPTPFPIKPPSASQSAEFTQQPNWNAPMPSLPNSYAGSNSSAHREGQGNIVKLVLGMGTALLAVGAIIIAAYALTSKTNLVQSLTTATKQAVGFDSRESILKDLIALRDRVEQAGKAVAEVDRNTKGAELLKSYQNDFNQIFFRACALSAVQRTGQDSLDDAVKRAEDLKKMREKIELEGGNQKNTFWSISLSDTSAWQHAIKNLTETSIYAEKLLNAQAEYPNPLELDHELGGWNDEDRRNLAVYWLQAKLARSLVHDLAPLVNQNRADDSELKKVYAVMDDFAAKGMEIARIPSTQSNKLLISVPKGTSYEFQAIVTKGALAELSALLRLKDHNPNEALKATIKTGLTLIDLLEDIQFSRTASLSQFASEDSWQAHQRTVRELAEKEQAKTIEEERTKLAAQDRERKRKEAEEQRRRDEEAKQAQSDQMANAETAGPQRGSNTPGPFGPRFAGPGPRPGMSGFGPPPNFGAPPNFGNGSPNTPPLPKMTSTGVTIAVSGVSQEQYQKMTIEVRNSFPTNSLSFSGGRLVIKIFETSHPLSEFKKLLPSLNIEWVDETSRTIEATMRL